MTHEELQVIYRELLDRCCEDGLGTFFETRDNEDLFRWLYQGSVDDVLIESGATKVVLSYTDLPYVIKFCFSGKTDYCKAEYENYVAAKEIPEITDCFAWCDYLFDYRGFSIYVMEKIDCSEYLIEDRAYSASLESACQHEGICEDSEDYKRFCDEFSSSYYEWDADEQMIDLLEKEWGSEIAHTFNDFCWENGINDRHSGNWGYRGDHLVIIDYSGFYGV